MPKIFLIKNRLHQQQLRLLEAQHLGKSPPPCSGKESPLGSAEPLSLIVNKHQCKFFFFFRLIKYFNNQENFLDYHLNRIYCYFDQTFHHQVIYFGLENKEIKIFSFSNLFFAFSYFNGEIIFKVQYSIDHKWSRIIVSIIHQLTFST